MRVLTTADPTLPVPPEVYGGIERIIATLVEKLSQRGNKVALLAHRDSECRADRRYEWPEKGGPISHTLALSDAVREFKPDVVHSFSRLAYLLPILRARRIPKLMSFQREPTPRTVKWANRMARGSLAFTGCSDYISSRGRATAGQWHTIHNFVDPGCYTFQPRVAEDAPFVFLSRVEPIKGAHLAIEACQRAGRKLIIAGNHSESDDPEGRYWREKIQRRINGTQIEYVGPVNDAEKNKLLGQAAALIVPVQWEEPFGIVFVEALACGTPIISCPRGALPEIVRDGVDGYLVEADGLESAIGQIASLRRSDCRQRVEERFSADVIVKKYQQLYDKIA